jgi:hypothetical protein
MARSWRLQEITEMGSIHVDPERNPHRIGLKTSLAEERLAKRIALVPRNGNVENQVIEILYCV